MKSADCPGSPCVRWTGRHPPVLKNFGRARIWAWPSCADAPICRPGPGIGSLPLPSPARAGNGQSIARCFWPAHPAAGTALRTVSEAGWAACPRIPNPATTPCASCWPPTPEQISCMLRASNLKLPPTVCALCRNPVWTSSRWTAFSISCLQTNTRSWAEGSSFSGHHPSPPCPFWRARRNLLLTRSERCAMRLSCGAFLPRMKTYARRYACAASPFPLPPTTPHWRFRKPKRLGYPCPA